MLRYSIIVPAYNSEATIVQCIESLMGQNCERACYEIIVVDDGSHDNTGFYVKKYSKVRYLYQKNQGPARARNFGVEQARCEIVLFTDADCEAAPGWLREMVKHFEDKEIIGVKGAYLSKQKKLVARFVQMEYESKYEKMKHDQYIDFVDTYSAAFRKKAFVAAGGYDSSFTKASVEDQEFSFRLAAKRCKLVFNPEAKVYHQHVDNIKDYFKKKCRIGFWKVLVLKRYPGKLLNDSHTPQTLKIEILLTGMILGWLPVNIFFTKHPLLYIVGGTGIVMYIALVIYEMRIHWKNSPTLVLYALIMIFIRSMALGIGFVFGILKLGGKNISG